MQEAAGSNPVAPTTTARLLRAGPTSGRETKQVAELIQHVQAGTRQAVEAMRAGAARVEGGSNRADLAGKALEAILEAAAGTARQVSEISVSAQSTTHEVRGFSEAMQRIQSIAVDNAAAGRAMHEQNGRVADASQSIAAIAEEQSTGVEEVSASSDMMNKQVRRVAAQAEELSATAERLENLLARFKTDSAVVELPVRLRRAA